MSASSLMLRRMRRSDEEPAGRHGTWRSLMHLAVRGLRVIVVEGWRTFFQRLVRKKYWAPLLLEEWSRLVRGAVERAVRKMGSTASPDRRAATLDPRAWNRVRVPPQSQHHHAAARVRAGLCNEGRRRESLSRSRREHRESAAPGNTRDS